MTYIHVNVIVIITFCPKKYLLILYYFLICYNKIKLTINIDFDDQSRLN